MTGGVALATKLHCQKPMGSFGWVKLNRGEQLWVTLKILSTTGTCSAPKLVTYYECVVNDVVNVAVCDLMCVSKISKPCIP